MGKLVFVGGAPGVGKTAVLEHLQDSFDRCAVLDADDLWRVRPFSVEPPLGPLWERAVAAALRSQLEAGFSVVFLGWVLADPAKIDGLLEGVGDLVDGWQALYLTASAEALAARSRAKRDRGLAADYQRLKATQIEALPFEKIDTTGLDAAGAARAIRDRLERGGYRPASERAREPGERVE